MGTDDKKKILWIDDDYFHLKSLAKPLKKKNYEFIPARSYEEALEELKKDQKFSVIILDLIIPYSETKIILPSISEETYIEGNEKAIDLIENGLHLFNYIKNELKLEVPILIVTIVQRKDLINGYATDKTVKVIHKLGFLSEDLEKAIIEIIQLNSADEVV